VSGVCFGALGGQKSIASQNDLIGVNDSFAERIMDKIGAIDFGLG
jgi:hypothetical protein